MARTAADMAEALGVERIAMLDTARNTHAEAVAAAELVGDASLILVTSASHMPRAMALFRAQGLDPIPARIEYLGLAWGRLQGML